MSSKIRWKYDNFIDLTNPTGITNDRPYKMKPKDITNSEPTNIMNRLDITDPTDTRKPTDIPGPADTTNLPI